MQLWNVHCKTSNITQDTSPLHTYLCSFNDIFPFYPFHWHEEAEIVLINGSATIRIDGNCFFVNNCIALFPPYSLHKIESTDKNIVVRGITLNFRTSSETNVSSTMALSPFFSSRYCFYTASLQSACFNTLLYHFNAVWQDKTKITDLVNLLKFFADSQKDNITNINQQKRNHSMRLAIEYITSHFNFDIDELSKHIGYSRFYTIKLFKDFSGITPIEYSNQFRLTFAEHLLLTTEQKIKDIALQSGYTNISYFNRQFLKLYGKTPHSLREQN